MTTKKWFIGINECKEREYLEDFEFSCDWYWSGGYIGHKNLHHHIDGLNRYENINLFDAIKKYYINRLALSDGQLWRFCDLFIQFYAYKKAAECFLYGGHMTSQGRTEEEINKEQNKIINNHIEFVIIPEIRTLMESI